MCGTEQPKEQPQNRTDDRGSNPVAINQFSNLFSIVSTCSRSLFSIANIFFILRGLLHLILFYFEILPMSSLNFFSMKMKQK